MEIEVTLRISNRIILFRTTKYEKINYMKSEGWKLVSQKRSILSTTYSFSKII